MAFQRGLDRGEIALRYQPVVRLADGRLAGMEGLARWHRSGAADPFQPDRFVPLAERCGLGLALTREVGRLAVREMGRMRGPLAVPVAINLPLAVLLRRDTIAWLHRLCQGGRLPPTRLGIELTETTPVRDLPGLRHAVERLRDAGHPVWIDDMSLDRRDALLKLPFSGIKIDRGLMEAAPRHRRARAEMNRLVRIAHGRGMVVVAEGVETPAQWRLAAMAEVDLAQGFAVARPVAAEGLAGWYAGWRQARAVPRTAEH